MSDLDLPVSDHAALAPMERHLETIAAEVLRSVWAALPWGITLPMLDDAKATLSPFSPETYTFDVKLDSGPLSEIEVQLRIVGFGGPATNEAAS